MEKFCPLCGKNFICNSDNISECQCTKVELSPQQRESIKQQFTDCLCTDCMRKIGDERKKR